MVPGTACCIALRDSAYIRMLDDSKNGFLTEFTNELYSCIDVYEVVVRNFLTPQLPENFFRISFKTGLLVILKCTS